MTDVWNADSASVVELLRWLARGAARLSWIVMCRLMRLTSV